ncbi:MAG: hypothetical protein JNM38_13125 [Acidobacteria bacterium]|jgi:hypothetical protein|nr:hypothetical protein [Acidobacteriota bacterium]
MFEKSFGVACVRVAASVAAVFVLTCATGAFAQEAPAAQPAPQAPPALTLTSDVAVLIHQIKADRTADFDWVMDKVKAALIKSTEPQHTAMAKGIQIYRSADAPPAGANVTYIVLVNPTVKEADYSMQNLLKLLYAAFPEEQQEIYKRVAGAFGGPTSRVNLTLANDFSK